jgi:hypothetical protein
MRHQRRQRQASFRHRSLGVAPSSQAREGSGAARKATSTATYAPA